MSNTSTGTGQGNGEATGGADGVTDGGRKELCYRSMVDCFTLHLLA